MTSISSSQFNRQQESFQHGLQLLYEEDFVAWADTMAQLLKQGKLDALDLEHLIEEVEDLGNRHRDSLRSQLTRLLMHLLKWEFQPHKQTGSWMGSIKESRKQIFRLLRDYPSLKNHLYEALSRCYQDAMEDASEEIGLPMQQFPSQCPYDVEKILDNDFLPNDQEEH
jgi:hypothetical protein